MTLAVTAEAELDLWGALSRGTRQVLDRVAQDRAAQATVLAEAQAAVHANLVELKRLEVLAERRAARRKAATVEAERRALDELATLRHGRR
jgi:flagellar biosynthesis chaperone FliJ